MFKRLVLTMVVLSLTASMAAADVGNSNPNDIVGVFNYNKDVGNPRGMGFTMDLGVGIEPGLGDTREYLITAGGADIWGTWDEFHMAYNMVSGDVRVSADLAWHAAQNGWSKYFVMLRDPGADGDASHYSMGSRNDETMIIWTGRTGTGGSAWDSRLEGQDKALVQGTRWGVQRVTSGGYTVVQGLYDTGDGQGWQVRGMAINPTLPDEIMAGVAVTSHEAGGLAQARVSNVLYETDIELIGITTVTGAGQEACSDIPGFQVTTMKRGPDQAEWGYGPAADLFSGAAQGSIMFPTLVFAESRIDPVVNLRDTGNGAFGDDRSFPGIDNFEQPAADPADGDDDNDFATQVLACIYLTEGLHIIGASSDDGTIITIGGTEVLRTEEWKGASNRDALFSVAEEGWYDLTALNMEGGGGASLELHEVLASGERILLGATDDQGNFLGSPVYAVPEPATIALLGLGGLSLLRRKRS